MQVFPATMILFTTSALLTIMATTASATGGGSYTPCPILGPRSPKPTQLAQSKYMQEALQNLAQALNDLSEGSASNYTETTPNTTSFSLALFDTSETSSDQKPYLFDYHYTAPSRTNSVVDASTVYDVGDVSMVLVVYSLLLTSHFDIMFDPVTKYIPELAAQNNSQPTFWADVRIIDLATQLSGIPLYAESNTVHGPVPDEFFELMEPREWPEQVFDTRTELINALSIRGAVYQPATTPIYSRVAFKILVEILQQLTGSVFDEIVKNKLAMPLGLSNTAVSTNFDYTNISYDAVNIQSTIDDMSRIGCSILASSLLPQSITNRWLKPYSLTSNKANVVGMPFEIYAPTLTGKSTGPVIEIFTKLGPVGLYSPYFGLVPDFDVGFVILSVDTQKAADLNAYADLIAEHILPALERTAMAEAAQNFAGMYSGDGFSMSIAMDGLYGLSVTNFTSEKLDLRYEYAQLAGIPAETLDFRLYPNNLYSGKKMGFQAIFQDVNAPVDAGTPTCVTWQGGVSALVHNGVALDQFVFTVGENGAEAVTIPAFNRTLVRGS